MNSAAILLSGGIDSTAVAFWKRPCLAITIDYGQAPAKGEIRAAHQIAKELDISHEVVTVDCQKLGAGDLAGKEPIPGSPASEWWPFRNQLLITLAAMHIISKDVGVLYLGSVKSDGFHADGTQEFYKKIDDLVRLQEREIRVEAPAISYDAKELVKKSSVPISLLGWTHSCHKAEFACGQCRGCNKHREIMSDLI